MSINIIQYDPQEDYNKGWRADFGKKQKSVLISPDGSEFYNDGSYSFSQKWGKLKAHQWFRKKKGGKNDRH